MNVLKRVVSAVLLMGMVGTGAAVAQYGNQQPRYEQGPGAWDAPPPEFAEAERRGFRDGVEGARKDYENHRRPSVNNRDEFRDPHFISPPDRRSYRIGFRRGYDVAVRHIYGPTYR
jgi:hypothetical protein